MLTDIEKATVAVTIMGFIVDHQNLVPLSEEEHKEILQMTEDLMKWAMDHVGEMVQEHSTPVLMGAVRKLLGDLAKQPVH